MIPTSFSDLFRALWRHLFVERGQQWPTPEEERAEFARQAALWDAEPADETDDAPGDGVPVMTVGDLRAMHANAELGRTEVIERVTAEYARPDEDPLPEWMRRRYERQQRGGAA